MFQAFNITDETISKYQGKIKFEDGIYIVNGKMNIENSDLN